MDVRYLNRIWGWMVLATLITFAVGETGLSQIGGSWTVGLIFALAYVKGMMVILDFMELRHAPALWRVALLVWITLTVSGILLAWWLARQA